MSQRDDDENNPPSLKLLLNTILFEGLLRDDASPVIDHVFVKRVRSGGNPGDEMGSGTRIPHDPGVIGNKYGHIVQESGKSPCPRNDKRFRGRCLFERLRVPTDIFQVHLNPG